MELEFTKMHGAGNDFVFIDCLKQNIANLPSSRKNSVIAASASAPISC